MQQGSVAGGGLVTDWKALADAEEASNVREYEERQARRERLKRIGMDLDDPMVRSMADRAHIPDEVWSPQMDGKAAGAVVCELDRRPWPCEVRVALRDICLCDRVEVGNVFNPDYVMGKINPECWIHGRSE